MQPTYTMTDLFETASRAPVLRSLARSTTPLSARAVGRAANISHTAAAATLKDLEAMGLTSHVRIGRADAYELVRANAYVERMVLPLIEAEQAIVDQLKADLTETFSEHCVSLILFGSYATGEQQELSDIDLFALAPDERRKQRIEEVGCRTLDHFVQTYGSPLSLLVYTLAEAREHLPVGRNPFRTELESTGIILHGLGVSEWGADEPQGENARPDATP